MTLQVLFVSPVFEYCVFVVGLLIGSFLNVVILRLPKQLKYEWRCQCEEYLELPLTNEAGPPSLVTSRSECPKCGHQITAMENIPLISYLFLRGKCSSCGTKISLRYPTIELLTGSLFFLVAFKFGATPQCYLALLLVAILISLAVIDFDHQLLPDNLTLPLIWLGLLASVFGIFIEPIDSIIGAVAGYMVLWLVFHLFKALTGKEGMGYGDFKLMAALGAWFGWQALPTVVVVSSVLGAIVGITLIIFGKTDKEQPISFGPFIAGAGWVYLMFGEKIVSTYFSLV